MPKCEQCGERPGFYAWPAANGTHALLCLDCSDKVRAIEDQSLQRQEQHLRHLEMLERHADHAADEIAFSVGMAPMGPRFRDQPRQQPAPIIQASGFVFNNISVNNSTVGAINTGTAHNIDVTITRLADEGNGDLARAIRDLTQLVVSSTALADAEKNEALQAIEVVAGEARKPENERRLGLVKPLLVGLDMLTSKSADLLQIWQTVKPLVATYFGIG